MYSIKRNVLNFQQKEPELRDNTNAYGKEGKSCVVRAAPAYMKMNAYMGTHKFKDGL